MPRDIGTSSVAFRVPAEMSPAMRRVLGIRRRVPDTTVRDLLCRLEPMRVRAALHRLVCAAHRRKALEPEQLPFGVAAMDGKSTAIDAIDNHYAQRHAEDENRGVVRTITASLASARCRPCIDAFPVHASTNETGQFESALDALMSAYQGLGLFRVVSYDAGACSLYNADRVRKHRLEYLFGLKNSQPTLRLEAERLLGCATDAAAKSEDVVGSNVVVRRVFVSDEIAGFLEWAHLTSDIPRTRSRTRRPARKRGLPSISAPCAAAPSAGSPKTGQTEPAPANSDQL